MSMSKSPDTAQQIKNIVSVFRALVTSRKQPCTLREILREYPEVESRPIYPNQLGYKSIEELLRESGEFVLTKLGGETCIAAKYSKNSSHIASLVRGQKSSGSKSNKAIKKAQIRQPYRPSDQSWNKSSYSSNVYQKLPSTLNRFIQSQNAMNGYGGGDSNNNTSQVNNRNNAHQHKQQTNNYNNNYNRTQQPQQQQQALVGGQKDLREKLKSGQKEPQKEQKDLREKLNTKKNNNNMIMPTACGKSQPQQQQQPTQDLRERLNMKQNQQQQQHSAQQNQSHQSQQQQQFHHQQQQQQANKDKVSPRAILGQNNNGANGAPNYAKQQQAISVAQLQNSNAIALASTMILAQRQQMVIQQHLQQANRQQTQQQSYQASAQRMSQQQQQPQHQQSHQHQQQQQQQKRYQPQQQQQQKSNHQNSASGGYHNKQPSHVVSLGPGVPGKNSVQDRLKIKITNNMCNKNNNNSNGSGGSAGITPDSSPALSSAGSDQPSPFGDRKSNVIKNNETHETQQIIPPKVFQFNPKLDPVTSLSQYCVVRRCSQPEYTFFRSKFSKLFQCHVLVNESIYSTYPNEYPNENLAKYSCASMAIDEIKIQESRRHLPVCPDTDQELTEKIFQELKSHPHGIFAKNLPEWFESTFKQLLPDHWWSLIEGSKQFITETSTRDSLIIFSNNDFEAGDNEEPETESYTLDSIKLPWSEKYWNLYITHCVSTTEIWARLFGKEYSEEFDNLMNEIDMHMLTEKTRPVSVACKQIYLVCIAECWHRVRLDEVDKLNAIGQCFFIDFGDEDWVPVSQLHICEKKFLKLAPQAVSFSLFGLEDFAGNPNAKRHLDAMLASKSVVGEILTKEEVYTAGNAEDSVINIQVVLYDTSSQEDVNLNPLVLHQICDDTPPPEIKRTGLTTVLITHITDAGDVFLQVRNSELQYVQKLIQQLIESKFKKDQHKVTRADIQSSNMFLICDKTNNQWYRGVLANATNKHLDEDEFDIFYIDYGMTKKTHISNMFQLESLSTALSKFPRQGIKARLDNIPPTTSAIIARMRGLLPADSRALVKIGTPSSIPLIIVYKRFEGSEALCNVNEVIRIEQELESSSTDLLDDSLTITLNDGKSSSGDGSSLPSPGATSRNNSSVDLQQTFRNLTIKTNSVPNSPQKSDYMLKLKNYEDVPNVGEFMDVRVTMSANPLNFVIQPYKDFPELRKLMKDLQEYCENNDEFIPVDMVEIGQVYAGKNKDGFFHRVIVVNKYQDMIHVSFCDFGDVDILRCDQLKTLPAKFRQLPKQAIQAKLYGITARNVDWALEDCLRFRELTVGQKFVSVIKKISNGDKISPDTRILELDLIDVKTDEDIFIRDILIKEQRAIEASSTDGLQFGE
ncbi:tudor domain-containing protein 7 [Episyrphus balteatus]|uniref:tudor domain-containing protein 7 n=1 Tax=Episyrphus balteatus TaxID=286459 RepID=UPI0024855D4B|nr:tudor domain-containing protein 7 [Episyrphus balteatus]XP_055857185.1 tudor domain-containing protein 7 [Episyrphus balteatus]